MLYFFTVVRPVSTGGQDHFKRRAAESLIKIFCCFFIVPVPGQDPRSLREKQNYRSPGAAYYNHHVN